MSGGFFFFSPGRTCQGFQNIVSGSYIFLDLLGVAAEVKEWAKSDSEDGWVLYSWDRVSFYFNWEGFTLFIPPCREETSAGFWGRYKKIFAGV